MPRNEYVIHILLVHISGYNIFKPTTDLLIFYTDSDAARIGLNSCKNRVRDRILFIPRVVSVYVNFY